MKPSSTDHAAIEQLSPQAIALSGLWTARGIGSLESKLDAFPAPSQSSVVVDGARIHALDTAGAWVLQKLLERLRKAARSVELRNVRPEFSKILDTAGQRLEDKAKDTIWSSKVSSSFLEGLGITSQTAWKQSLALLSFIGETAVAAGGWIAHPERIRGRPVLSNIRSAGFDALPIVGLLSFLLGIVIAYQGADQLKQYGANIFVVDLVGLSMLREFAPLITAIIIAGRSGSAYAAQIGAMAVTEEIDAMRTIGIAPLDVLVLPKIVALVVALPLLTVFSDLLGVLGGMVMARAQLGVGFGEFIDRFGRNISLTSYLVGIGKAPVFAAIIAVIGCFQGFRTKGGADSVGRQTTRSVVQSIFLVIVADAMFSIAFSALDL
ncbi:MlaE family lipid ABC transporter permease subunit [Undibacterium sp. Jales W-56]|uniref:ABC transporter permease n=1 Tax=Undibacterium sp. Jales W-56 TaxID=2897325 RepID=UPI0021D05E50|nr:MlaE family lipid ABC transporter permease subunit [Undibacterium sp. Jales W-56]MCU6435006.1 MlaE family lipid ABC transporter permease subunit [Undibacterium sp. Jales W-56]